MSGAGFSVVAIVAAYNEGDILGHVIGDLIAQGVQVYLLDDGSTDNTVAIAERHLGQGVLGVERLRTPVLDGSRPPFEWRRILERKADLSRELDADWFIHHDADEFRESPWAHMPLGDAIRRVDALGFNAIDFASLDFWPVGDTMKQGDDVRLVHTFYSEGAAYDRVQIRAWKKTSDVDLAGSGGHEATFAGRRVFPLRFVLRHYPIRGQAHGERKVFHERRNRFTDEERALGWHVQYDDWTEGVTFVRDPSTLTAYDPDAFRVALALRHRGVEELRASMGDLQASLVDARAAAETRQRELDATLQEFERVDREAEDRRAEGEALRAQVDDLLAQVQTARAHITHVESELALTQQAIADTRTHIATCEAEIARLQDAAVVSRREIQRLQDALSLRDREIHTLRASESDGVRRLQDFHGSLSWRWTAPARALYRLLRGL